MKKNRILILGGGYAEVPLIKAAKNMGNYVITTGNQKDGVGHSYGDKYVDADFSNCELMLDIAKRENITAICSGCNDFALLSTAYVAEKMGLEGHDSYDVSKLLHHKDRYRKFAESINIPSPKAMVCKDINDVIKISDNLSFPVMVKPVDLTGGKGITMCESLDEAIIAFEKSIDITREKYVIIEEFVEGSRHGFTGLLQNQKMTFYFGDDEHYYKNQYMVEGASTPSKDMSNIYSKLVKYSEMIARELKLVDGIFHIQYILKDGVEPIIIEICRRAPGDLYVELVEKSTGVEYAKEIVCLESGIKRDIYCMRDSKDYWIRHCVMSEKTGVIKKINYNYGIEKYIDKQLVWANQGDCIKNSMTYKAGIIFLKFKNRDKFLEVKNNIHRYINIEVCN